MINEDDPFSSSRLHDIVCSSNEVEMNVKFSERIKAYS